MLDPIIRTRRLTRYFASRPVVRDLNMSVPQGQVSALLGLNGVGKTTTIRMIMGLLQPTRGACEVFGANSCEMSSETRIRIGYLVEGHFLYRSMSVSQCEAFQRHGFPHWDDRMFQQILAHFGISRAMSIGQLSRGQRAGVALALVLAPEPELLVLDDPALGLDPVSRRALNETLIEFAADGQRTVLLSTHLLDDVERVADRVMVMVDGRLKVDTTMDEFCRRVSTYSIERDQIEPETLRAIPGLIQVRRVGNRHVVTVADVDEEARAALSRISSGAVEEVGATFSDSVLAYLASYRHDGSFFTCPNVRS